MITNNSNHYQQDSHANINRSTLSNQNQSLQIVQPQPQQNRLSLLTGHHDQKSENHNYYKFQNTQQDDILNYSTQNSFNVNVNLVDQSNRISINYVLQDQQPAKRKRKQIFAKYKKPIHEQQVQQADKKFQETLDQLFNTKNQKLEQEKLQVHYQQQPKKEKTRFQKFKKDNVLQINNITNNNNLRSQNRSQQLIKNQKSVQSNNKSQKSSSLKYVYSTDEDLNQKQKNDLSNIPFRISQIRSKQSNLDDSKDLQNMLQSPIFVLNQQKQQPYKQKICQKQNNLIEQKFVSINNVNVQTPKIVILPQQIKNLSPTISQRQNIYQYDKIDISQNSINNSIMVRGVVSEPVYKNSNNNEKTISISNDQFFKNIQPNNNNQMNRNPKILITFGNNNVPYNANNNNQLNPIVFQQKIFQNPSIQPLSDKSISQEISFEKQNDMEQKAYEQSRIPIFLRKARKQNSHYPNFYHQDSIKYYDEENIRLQKLVTYFDKALTFLEQMALQINQKVGKSIQFQKRFENGFRLDFFLNSQWQKQNNIQRIQELKPKGSFAKRPFEFQKIQAALNSYRDIVKYYQNVRLNFNDQKGRQKFIDIRKKFWSIQWNLRVISEDLYSQTLKVDFPLFYHECLDFLKRPFPKTITKQAIEQRRYLTGKYCHMKQQKDPLTNSQIGQVFKQKLDKQMKFLCPY